MGNQVQTLKPRYTQVGKEYGKSSNEELAYHFENENITCINPCGLERFESKVVEICSDYIKTKTQPKPHIAALSFVLFHLTELMRDVLIKGSKLSSLYKGSDWDNDKYRFVACRNTATGARYCYNGKKISQKVLIACWDYLKEEKQWIHTKHGNNFPNTKTQSSTKWQKGFIYLNHEKFYQEFYCLVEALFEEVLTNTRKEKHTRDYLVVKQLVKSQNPVTGKIEEKWLNQNIATKGWRNYGVMKESRRFLKSLEQMYLNTKLSLAKYEDCDAEKQKLVWKKLLDSDPNASVCPESVTLGLLNKKVNTYNTQFNFVQSLPVEAQPYPYRVFHYDENTGEFVWGRIYGNKCGIDNLNTYLVPLLKIDDCPTTTLDVKSCYLQLFILKNGMRATNFQDFYSYEGLDNFKRSDIKLLVQCLNNSENRNKARSAFSSHYKDDKGNPFRSLTQKDFDAYVDTMLKQRPYLKGMFYKPFVCKSLTRTESDYFIDVMKILLKQNIHFVSQNLGPVGCITNRLLIS